MQDKQSGAVVQLGGGGTDDADPQLVDINVKIIRDFAK